jgi:hypothetical protein
MNEIDNIRDASLRRIGDRAPRRSIGPPARSRSKRTRAAQPDLPGTIVCLIRSCPLQRSTFLVFAQSSTFLHGKGSTWRFGGPAARECYAVCPQQYRARISSIRGAERRHGGRLVRCASQPVQGHLLALRNFGGRSATGVSRQRHWSPADATDDRCSLRVRPYPHRADRQGRKSQCNRALQAWASKSRECTEGRYASRGSMKICIQWLFCGFDPSSRPSPARGEVRDGSVTSARNAGAASEGFPREPPRARNGRKAKHHPRHWSRNRVATPRARRHGHPRCGCVPPRSPGAGH